MSHIYTLFAFVHNSIAFATELDLDYLERRGGNTITYEGAEGGSKEEDSPADTLDRVKVVFLGAPGVGKTSIIRVKSFHDRINYLSLCISYKNVFYPVFLLIYRILNVQSIMQY